MHRYYFVIVVVGQTASELKCFSNTLLILMNNMKLCSHRFKHTAIAVLVLVLMDMAGVSWTYSKNLFTAIYGVFVL